VPISLSTLYYYCNDVEAMRDFYTGLLGLEETYFRNDDAAGWYTLTAEPLEPQPGYRQYVVRDPMGFTVEVYCSEDGR
jgi:catechol 2,3-dioxygenase-like lactoylglutathione lyase family enzyme